MKILAAIACSEFGVFIPSKMGFGLVCLVLGLCEASADPTPPKLSDIPAIQFAEVFQYSVSGRDPFVDSSVVQTLLSQKGQTPDVARKEPDLEGYVEDFNQLLAEFYAVRGVVCSASGGSALVGRRILRPGDTVDIFLGEALLKRLEQSNRIYNLGLDEVLHNAVMQGRVAKVEPTGVMVEMQGLKSLLEIPFHKNKAAASSPNEKSAPQKRK